MSGFERACARCGVEFVSKRRGRKYCSMECSAAAIGLLRRKPHPGSCERCGKSIVTRGAKRTQRFCSRRCGTASRMLKPVACGVCGHAFRPPSRRAIYCSRECSNKGPRGATYKLVGGDVRASDLALVLGLTRGALCFRLREAGLVPGDEVPLWCLRPPNPAKMKRKP